MNRADYLLHPEAQQPQHAICLRRVRPVMRMHAVSLPAGWAAFAVSIERGDLVSDRAISPIEISCLKSVGEFPH
jgi:hypothetical protein